MARIFSILFLFFVFSLPVWAEISFEENKGEIVFDNKVDTPSKKTTKPSKKSDKPTKRKNKGETELDSEPLPIDDKNDEVLVNLKKFQNYDGLIDINTQENTVKTTGIPETRVNHHDFRYIYGYLVGVIVLFLFMVSLKYVLNKRKRNSFNTIITSSETEKNLS